MSRSIPVEKFLRLMAFTMWYGRFPEIISEYELEEMIEHGTEVITLYPMLR